MDHFPLGTMNFLGADNVVIELDRRTWFQEILPYVEQQAIFDQYMTWADWAATAQRIWDNGMWNSAPNRWVPLALFQCPSDPANPKTRTFGATDDQYHNQGMHGNYVLCAGSEFFNPLRTSGGNSRRSDGSDLNGLFFYNSRIRIGDILDGTSNTLMGSEIILSADVTTHDTRGRYWNNARQGSVLFSTLYPPNTPVPDHLQWCQSIPHAPCTSGNTDIVLSARSHHAGVVNALLADGAVRSIAESINATTYQNLGSRAGGEVPNDY
jgi:hypothetical protein